MISDGIADFFSRLSGQLEQADPSKTQVGYTEGQGFSVKEAAQPSASESVKTFNALLKRIETLLGVDPQLKRNLLRQLEAALQLCQKVEKIATVLMAAEGASSSDVASLKSCYKQLDGAKVDIVKKIVTLIGVQNITGSQIAALAERQESSLLLRASRAGLDTVVSALLKQAVLKDPKDALKMVQELKIEEKEKTELLKKFCLVAWTEITDEQNLRDLMKEELFKKVCNLDVRDEKKRTPILIAIDRGFFNAADTLLDNSADVCVKDDQGRTPLIAMVSRLEHDDFLIKLSFKSRAVSDAQDAEGRTALMIWLEPGQGYDPLTKRLIDNTTNLNAQNREGKTILEIAAAQSAGMITGYLIGRGADATNMTQGKNPLDWAYKLSETKKSAMLDALLEAGADVSKTHDRGLSLLRWAEEKVRPIATIATLIERGLNPNMALSTGKTLLEMAVEKKESHLLKILVEKGATFDKESKFAQSCLELAYNDNNQELLAILKKEGVVEVFLNNLKQEFEKTSFTETQAYKKALWIDSKKTLELAIEGVRKGGSIESLKSIFNYTWEKKANFSEKESLGFVRMEELAVQQKLFPRDEYLKIAFQRLKDLEAANMPTTVVIEEQRAIVSSILSSSLSEVEDEKTLTALKQTLSEVMKYDPHHLLEFTAKNIREAFALFMAHPTRKHEFLAQAKAFATSMKKEDYKNVLQALEKQFPSYTSQLKEFDFSVRYSVNLAHFTKINLNPPLPPKPASITMRDLKTQLSQVNFTDSTKPGFVDPYSISKTGLDGIKNDLDTFIGWIENRTSREGTGEGNQKEAFYKNMETLLGHIINSLNLHERENPEKAAKLRAHFFSTLMPDIGECGPGLRIRIIVLYGKIVQNIDPIFANKVYQALGEMRNNNLSTLIKADKAKGELQTVHFLSHLMFLFGDQLAIPNANLYALHKDEFINAGGEVNVRDIKIEFDSLYLAWPIYDMLVSTIETDFDFRGDAIDWLKENVRGTFENQKPFDALIKEVQKEKRTETALKMVSSTISNLNMHLEVNIKKLIENKFSEQVVEAQNLQAKSYAAYLQLLAQKNIVLDEGDLRPDAGMIDRLEADIDKQVADEDIRDALKGELLSRLKGREKGQARQSYAEVIEWLKDKKITSSITSEEVARATTQMLDKAIKTFFAKEAAKIYTKCCKGKSHHAMVEGLKKQGVFREGEVDMAMKKACFDAIEAERQTLFLKDILQPSRPRLPLKNYKEIEAVVKSCSSYKEALQILKENHGLTFTVTEESSEEAIKAEITEAIKKRELRLQGVTIRPEFIEQMSVALEVLEPLKTQPSLSKLMESLSLQRNDKKRKEAEELNLPLLKRLSDTVATSEVLPKRGEATSREMNAILYGRLIDELKRDDVLIVPYDEKKVELPKKIPEHVRYVVAGCFVENQHAVAIVIDRKTKKMHYFDSLFGNQYRDEVLYAFRDLVMDQGYSYSYSNLQSSIQADVQKPAWSCIFHAVENIESAVTGKQRFGGVGIDGAVVEQKYGHCFTDFAKTHGIGGSEEKKEEKG